MQQQQTSSQPSRSSDATLHLQWLGPFSGQRKEEEAKTLTHKVKPWVNVPKQHFRGEKYKFLI